jgi:hypothetical protein
MLTSLFEIDHNFRRVFADGHSHPKDLDMTWYETKPAIMMAIR